jgi:hypothetical protein
MNPFLDIDGKTESELCEYRNKLSNAALYFSSVGYMDQYQNILNWIDMVDIALEDRRTVKPDPKPITMGD